MKYIKSATGIVCTLLLLGYWYFVPPNAQSEQRFTVELRRYRCGIDCKNPDEKVEQYLLIDHKTKLEYPFNLSADEPEKLLFMIPSESTYTCIHNGDYAYVKNR